MIELITREDQGMTEHKVTFPVKQGRATLAEGCGKEVWQYWHL